MTIQTRQADPANAKHRGPGSWLYEAIFRRSTRQLAGFFPAGVSQKIAEVGYLPAGSSFRTGWRCLERRVSSQMISILDPILPANSREEALGMIRDRVPDRRRYYLLLASIPTGR